MTLDMTEFDKVVKAAEVIRESQVTFEEFHAWDIDKQCQWIEAGAPHPLEVI
jgi:hypothetical protein